MTPPNNTPLLQSRAAGRALLQNGQFVGKSAANGKEVNDPPEEHEPEEEREEGESVLHEEENETRGENDDEGAKTRPRGRGGSALGNGSESGMVVPLPVFTYSRPYCVGSNGSNPLLGDMFEPRCGTAQNTTHEVQPGEEHGEEEEAEEIEEEGIHEHGAQAMLVLFYLLIAGMVTTHVLERYFPFVPYTAAIFLVGLILSLLQGQKRVLGLVFSETFDKGMLIWQHANPRLMLYIFLPPLIFGEAMTMNVCLVRRCFNQCMLLAVPGVFIGTALTGVFGKFVLPYEWDWNTSFLFGSILSATDPVAVVAIFNALGVAPRLTMVMTGESLFNDGTAYLLFVLFDLMSTGVRPTMAYVIEFFVRMVTVGPFIGFMAAVVALIFLGLSDGERYPGDIMSQITCTLVAAYMPYIWSEEAHTSAVLSVVAVGYTVASKGWPRFIARNSLSNIWHVIEFVGNTCIFALAGILFGGVLFDRARIINERDWLFLGVTYLACTLIRAIMVAGLWVPLNLVGHPLTVEEGLVIVWSGMRGAVGLLMAVAADRNEFISRETGARIMFHMGGMSMLMLIVNGPLTPLILRLCKLTDPSDKEHVVSHYKVRIALRTKQELKATLKDPKFKHITGGDGGVTMDEVAFLIPAMEQGPNENVRSMLSRQLTTFDDSHREVRMRMMRESFLRVVKNGYWELCDKGVLPRRKPSTLVLLDSADVSLMDSSLCIKDWDLVRAELHIGEFKDPEDYRRRAPMRFRALLEHDQYIQQSVEVAIAFLHVHENALDKVKVFASAGAETSEEEHCLYKEVADQNLQVAQYVNSRDTGHDHQTVQAVRTRMLAAMVLQHHAEQAQTLAKQGLISETNATAIEAESHRDARSLAMLKMSDALVLLSGAQQ